MAAGAISRSDGRAKGVQSALHKGRGAKNCQPAAAGELCLMARNVSLGRPRWWPAPEGLLLCRWVIASSFRLEGPGREREDESSRVSRQVRITQRREHLPPARSRLALNLPARRPLWRRTPIGGGGQLDDTQRVNSPNCNEVNFDIWSRRASN